MERTSGSIHGIHQTFASPGLPDFFARHRRLLKQLSIAGLSNWVDYGIRNYPNHPERQRDYFSLQSADSRAVLQRERHGTLLVDRSACSISTCAGCGATARDWYRIRPTRPAAATAAVLRRLRHPPARCPRRRAGRFRHRPLPRHPGAHRRPSALEHADVRRQLQPDAAPGDRGLRRQPHRNADPARLPGPAPHLPRPAPDAARRRLRPGNHHSCLRHRLACSRARCSMPNTATRTRASCASSSSLPRDDGQRRVQQRRNRRRCALAYVARTRRQSDQLANVHFADTEIAYRDDNRHLWRFHELSDDEEMFDELRPTAAAAEVDRLPPRHYPEWDYQSQSYRPDWVSLYESLHPAGDAALISTACSKSTPRWPASEAPARSPRRRTGCASATRKMAANSTSTSPSAR
jgi:nitric oxide reductase NorD protein